MTTPDPAEQSGADLVERLERTLGIAVLVESVDTVDPGGATTIEASFMFGSSAHHVAVAGSSEAGAWEELARAAIAWRNSDFQHIPMWPGGG